MFMKIELWSLDRIRPYPNNPRINDDAVDAVAASIREFGVRQAIVVDTEGVIICGHTRFKAAQKLGLDKLPVHVAKDLIRSQVMKSSGNATARSEPRVYAAKGTSNLQRHSTNRIAKRWTLVPWSLGPSDSTTTSGRRSNMR